MFKPTNADDVALTLNPINMKTSNVRLITGVVYLIAALLYVVHGVIAHWIFFLVAIGFAGSGVFYISNRDDE